MIKTTQDDWADVILVVTWGLAIGWIAWEFEGPWWAKLIMAFPLGGFGGWRLYQLRWRALQRGYLTGIDTFVESVEQRIEEENDRVQGR